MYRTREHEVTRGAVSDRASAAGCEPLLSPVARLDDLAPVHREIRSCVYCGNEVRTYALLSWLLQKYAAHRGLAIRIIYGVLIYFLLFAGIGGLLELGYGVFTHTGTIDFSLSGIYFLSLGAFYGFAISMVGQPLLWMIGLFLSAGIILALVGPRKIY